MAPAPGTVVVGVDATRSSRSTIRLAAREARCRDARLMAVLAYSGDTALGAPGGRPLSTLRTPADDRAAAESALRDAVVDALGEEADRVDMRTVLGLAGRSLVDTARKASAELIVLASRGTTSMLLGTVSQYVLRRAPCPVLMVPENG
jgi:nucleotide-binding universal stress UspA family protein